MSREFEKTIFLGAGEWSVLEVQRLKERLDKGFDILSALQQGSHEFGEERCLEFEKELSDVIDDISTALGRTIGE